MSYDFGYAVKVFKNTIMTQYWDVNGRTNRRDFWHYVSISVIISILLSVLAGIVPVLGILSTIFSLGLLAPNIGLGIRRIHDIDKPWWFFLIPLYNIYLYCQPGTPGANTFGEPATSPVAA